MNYPQSFPTVNHPEQALQLPNVPPPQQQQQYYAQPAILPITIRPSRYHHLIFLLTSMAIHILLLLLLHTIPTNTHKRNSGLGICIENFKG
jgi:hypothetical protein